MSGLITGGKISGATFKGQKNLASIGDIIWWFDYRFLAEIDDSNRVARWRSLASNYGIQALAAISPSDRPFVFSDGFGRDPSDDQTLLFTTHNYTEIFRQRFLTHTPFAIFTVAKRLDGGSESNASIEICGVRNAANTNQVFFARCVRRGGRTELGLNLEIESGTGSVDDEFSLCQHIYYGDLGGANNVRIKAKATSTLSVNSGAIVPPGPIYSWMFSTVNVTDFLTKQRYKLSLAYNLNGKTPAEIDAFCTVVENTIKEDPEYASLIT